MERLTKRMRGISYSLCNGIIIAKCEHCNHRQPSCYGEDCGATLEVTAKLAAYEDADDQKRLHISPCADGTGIWCIIPEGCMFFDDSIDYDNGFQLLSETYVHGYTEFGFGELGVDWFFTREEAEAALKEK